MNYEDIKRHFESNPAPKELKWTQWAYITDTRQFLESCYIGISNSRIINAIKLGISILSDGTVSERSALINQDACACLEDLPHYQAYHKKKLP